MKPWAPPAAACALFFSLAAALDAGGRLGAAPGAESIVAPDAVHMGRALAVEGRLALHPDGEDASARRALLYPAFIGLAQAWWGDPVLPRLLAAQAAGLALVVGGAAALAWLLAGPWAAALAAAAAAMHGELAVTAGALSPEAFSVHVLLLVALALGYWARERSSPRAGLLLGAALGLMLSTKSPLAPVPALLAALSRRRSAVLLLAAAYLPLLPWTARNLAVFGELVPFERAGAGMGLYAAALGHVEYPYDGGASVYAAADAEDPAWRSASVSEGYSRLGRLARRRLLAAPGAYLAGCVRRFYKPVRIYWPLFALGLLGWAARRRDPAWAAVSGLALYFVGVHSLLALHTETIPHYFTPLLPVLYAWGAAGAAAAARAAGGQDARPALAAAGLLLAPLAAAYAYGAAGLARERFLSPREPAAVAGTPEALAARGDYAAADALAARTGLESLRVSARFAESRALLLSGDRRWRSALARALDLPSGRHLLISEAALLSSRPREGAAWLEEAARLLGAEGGAEQARALAAAYRKRGGRP